MSCSEPISWLRFTSCARRAYEEPYAGSSPQFWFPPLVRDGKITGLFQLCQPMRFFLGQFSGTGASVSLPSLLLPLEPLLLLLEVLLLLPELLPPEVLWLLLERGEDCLLYTSPSPRD